MLLLIQKDDAIIEMYFSRHDMLIHQWEAGDGGVGSMYWSKRVYPGEKPNSSRAVGGQLVWVDLELRGRPNEKINMTR